MDTHETEFLEGIWPGGREEGPLSSMARSESADLAPLDLWTRRSMRASTIEEIIG